MKKPILLFMLISIATACSNNNSGRGSADSITPEILRPEVESLVTSDANAESKSKAFLAEVVGKKLVFNGEVSRTIENGAIQSEQKRSVEDCFQQKEIAVTDSTGKVVRREPTDNIISLKFINLKYAIEVTQTSPGKAIRTQYSLDSDSNLHLSLVEATSKSVNFKLGGAVILQDDKLVLRSGSETSQLDTIFIFQ